MFGLRWTLAEQEQRCKYCLQSLQNPARVGRPSHNLLEWNGTELNCKWGHGLLSIPEIETSWGVDLANGLSLDEELEQQRSSHRRDRSDLGWLRSCNR